MPALDPIRMMLLASVLWTLVVGASVGWRIDSDRRGIMERAYAEAQTSLNKDLALRRWATRHGGVYVPITETQKSVEWLAHVPGRDVQTTDGRALTLLNPASMVRQLMDAYAEESGVRGRITGLRYLNPGNAPDPWERAQMEAFARGERSEVWEIADYAGKPALRYLRAMFMEPGCDLCHAILGYRTGDFRGATGLILPLDAYLRQIDGALRLNVVSHGVIWLIGLVGILLSGSALRRREAERQLEATRFRDIAQISSDWIWEVDAGGRYTFASDSVRDLLGYRPDEIVGKTAFDLMPPAEAQRVGAEFGRIAAARVPFRNLENIVLGKDGVPHVCLTNGMPILDVAGRLVGYRGVDRDVSEEREMAEKVRHLAYHDGLTGLPNRQLLADRLNVVMASSRRNNCHAALMFLDLDNFKPLNDLHGHDVGDLLLIEVADRLRASVRKIDTVARFGGDEFVVLLGDLDADHDASTEQARVVAEKIREALARPYRLTLRREGRPDAVVEHACTVSIGAVVFISDDEITAEDLIRKADAAMYEAKACGRNSVCFRHAGDD